MAASTTTAQKAPSVWSSFFGKVAGGLGAGLEKVSAEIMPNWTAKQAGLQKTDQLKKPSYDEQKAPKRVETAIGAVEQVVETPLFKVGGFQFKTSHALLAVAGLLGVLLVIRLGR